jgi:predicted RNase H-like HicB family nuclease
MDRQYPAIVHKERESDYGVSFPDFPGCATAGKTPEEAYAMAVEALQLHVDGLLEDKEPLPEPSPLSEVVGLVRELEGLVAFLVPVRLPGRARHVDITLDENLLGEVDRAATAQGMSRSGFLAEGARRLIREHEPAARTPRARVARRRARAGR